MRRTGDGQQPVARAIGGECARPGSEAQEAELGAARRWAKEEEAGAAAAAASASAPVLLLQRQGRAEGRRGDEVVAELHERVLVVAAVDSRSTGGATAGRAAGSERGDSLFSVISPRRRAQRRRAGRAW